MKASQLIGLLTVSVSLTVAASALPAIAQQRICVESERDGRIVCGRRVNDSYNRPDKDGGYYDRNENSGRCGSNFDEQFYLTAYGDVADAVRRRTVNSACDHYLKFGRFEGRSPRFNESSYLSKNPDVAEAVRRGKVRSAYDHWLKYGRYENRQI